MRPMPVLIFATLACFGGCITQAQRKAAENAAIQKQAAREVRRICALPRPERDAEIERVETEWKIVVQCAND